MKKNFYITTAIAYPNAQPHMGHALEIIQADALARMYRMIGKDVVFQTGTDEHGIKNRRKAKQENKSIMEFLDHNTGLFKTLYDRLSTSYDKFVRTSNQEEHYIGAHKLRNKLMEKGDLYKKSYKGLYCASCEKFVTEKELIDAKCPDHQTLEIEVIEEENYFFRLSKYKDQVIELIESDKYIITPKSRKNEILEFLKNAQDVSFSRPTSSLPRGIPVPNDPEHVMYVRCDALSNYITGQGYENNINHFESTRPADIHIIGKDILRFHAAFWPAMLLSADLEIPAKLIAHGFLTINGMKMSKSLGNGIDPIELLDRSTRDGLVFQLLYDVALDSDGDFSEERLNNMYDAMLIGGRGNLVNRVTSLCQKYNIRKGSFNHNSFQLFKDDNNTLIKLFESGFDNYYIEHTYLKKDDLQLYIQDRYRLVQKANEFMTKSEPWKKYKDNLTQNEAISDLQFLLYIVKKLSLLISPILIDGFEKIQEILGNEEIQKINTKSNFENKLLFKEIFDMEDFDVNLNPQIIYQKKEDV